MDYKDFNLILLNAARVERRRWEWQNVSSPFARIYMLESGEARIITQAGIQTLRPGFLYLVPSFALHSYDNTAPFVINYLHVYNEYDIFSRYSFPFEVEASELEKLLIERLLSINPERGLQHPDPRIYDNLTSIRNIISKSRHNARNIDVETRAILQLLFLRFMNKAQPQEFVRDDRIKKVLRFIRENIEKQIYIEDLASQCNLHKDYFVRLFKKEIGCNPMQYINRKKIEKAQMLLLISDDPVKNIAYDLAFDNIPYFHSLFKKIAGMSPLQYRNRSQT
jgi:AraC-like DNA-binding protein